MRICFKTKDGLMQPLSIPDDISRHVIIRRRIFSRGDVGGEEITMGDRCYRFFGEVVSIPHEGRMPVWEEVDD